MSEERLQEIKDSVNLQREILKAHNMETLCVDEEQELIEEIERLNNIINGTDEILKEHINECRAELNTIMKGNDLNYINQCSIQFNVIRNNIEMIMKKINKLKGDGSNGN